MNWFEEYRPKLEAVISKHVKEIPKLLPDKWFVDSMNCIEFQRSPENLDQVYVTADNEPFLSVVFIRNDKTVSLEFRRDIEGTWPDMFKEELEAISEGADEFDIFTGALISETEDNRTVTKVEDLVAHDFDKSFGSSGFYYYAHSKTSVFALIVSAVDLEIAKRVAFQLTNASWGFTVRVIGVRGPCVTVVIDGAGRSVKEISEITTEAFDLCSNIHIEELWRLSVCLPDGTCTRDWGIADSGLTRYLLPDCKSEAAAQVVNKIINEVETRTERGESTRFH